MEINCFLGRRELLDLLMTNIQKLNERFKEESKTVKKDLITSSVDDNISSLVSGLLYKFYSSKSISNLKRILESNNIYSLMSSEELYCLNEQIEKTLNYKTKENSNLYENITAFYDDYNVAFRDYGNYIGKQAKEKFYTLTKKVPISVIKKNKQENNIPNKKILKQIDCNDEFYEETTKSINERLDKIFSINLGLKDNDLKDSELTRYIKTYLKIISQKGISLFGSESISGELLSKLYLGFYGLQANDILKKIKKEGNSKALSVISAQDDVLLSYIMVMLSATRDLLNKKEDELCNENRYSLSEKEKNDIYLKTHQIGIITKKAFMEEYIAKPIDYLLEVEKAPKAKNIARKKTE